jgi:hypothetical protein
MQTQMLWNQESNINLDLCLFIKPYTNSGSGWRVIRYCSGASHFPIVRQHQGLLGDYHNLFGDSFVDDAVVGEQSELAGFHIF